jgi:hypothetical protein
MKDPTEVHIAMQAVFILEALRGIPQLETADDVLTHLDAIEQAMKLVNQRIEAIRENSR